jgi:hypothetical protein
MLGEVIRSRAYRISDVGEPPGDKPPGCGFAEDKRRVNTILVWVYSPVPDRNIDTDLRIVGEEARKRGRDTVRPNPRGT